MKKYCSFVIIVISIMLFFSGQVSANTYSKAKELYDLNLYKGISVDSFNPDLNSELDRQTAVVMLLRIFGEENQAIELSDENAKEILKAKFNDYDTIAPWAIRQVAYGVDKGYISGYPDDTFRPKEKLVGRAYCALSLKLLAYSFEYENAGQVFGEVGNLPYVDWERFGVNEPITKGVLVDMSYSVLSMNYYGQEKNVAGNLVEKGLVSQADFLSKSTIVPSANKEVSITNNSLDGKQLEDMGLEKVPEILENDYIRYKPTSSWYQMEMEPDSSSIYQVIYMSTDLIIGAQVTISMKDDVVDSVDKFIEQMVIDGVVKDYDVEDTVVGNQPAKKLIYQLNRKDNYMYLVEGDSVIYVFSCALQSGESKEKHLADFQVLLSTIQFKNVATE
jgi:hypothetical protein